MQGGKRIGAGRPTGTPNKVTQELREVLHQFTAKALADLPTMFANLESDKERIEVLIRLLPYVAPRLQSIALQAPEQDAEPLKITIVYPDNKTPFANSETEIRDRVFSGVSFQSAQ